METSGEDIFTSACLLFLFLFLSAAGWGERGKLPFCDDRRFLGKNETVGTLGGGGLREMMGLLAWATEKKIKDTGWRCINDLMT